MRRILAVVLAALTLSIAFATGAVAARLEFPEPSKPQANASTGERPLRLAQRRGNVGGVYNAPPIIRTPPPVIRQLPPINRTPPAVFQTQPQRPAAPPMVINRPRLSPPSGVRQIPSVPGNRFMQPRGLMSPAIGMARPGLRSAFGVAAGSVTKRAFTAGRAAVMRTAMGAASARMVQQPLRARVAMRQADRQAIVKRGRIAVATLATGAVGVASAKALSGGGIGNKEGGGATSGGGGQNHQPSAIKEASYAAFKAADSASSFNVSKKHLPNAKGNYAKFRSGENIQKLVSDALRSQDALLKLNNQPASFKVETDFGRAIGTAGETKVRIIVGSDGKIWTAFPIK